MLMKIVGLIALIGVIAVSEFSYDIPLFLVVIAIGAFLARKLILGAIATAAGIFAGVMVALGLPYILPEGMPFYLLFWMYGLPILIVFFLLRSLILRKKQHALRNSIFALLLITFGAIFMFNYLLNDNYENMSNLEMLESLEYPDYPVTQEIYIYTKSAFEGLIPVSFCISENCFVDYLNVGKNWYRASLRVNEGVRLLKDAVNAPEELIEINESVLDKDEFELKLVSFGDGLLMRSFEKVFYMTNLGKSVINHSEEISIISYEESAPNELHFKLYENRNINEPERSKIIRHYLLGLK